MKTGDLVRVAEPRGRKVTGVWIDSLNHWRGADIESGSIAIIVVCDPHTDQIKILVGQQALWVPAEFVQPGTDA